MPVFCMELTRMELTRRVRGSSTSWQGKDSSTSWPRVTDRFTLMQDRLTAKLQEAVEKQMSDIPDSGSEIVNTTRRNGAIGFSTAQFVGRNTEQYNHKPMGIYVPQGSSSDEGAPPPLQPMDEGTWAVTGEEVCEGTFAYCVQGENFDKTILVMWYIKDSSVDDNSNLWNIHIVPGQVTPGETIHNDLKTGAGGYPAPITPQDKFNKREYQDKDLNCELQGCMTGGPNCTLDTGIIYF